MSSSKSKYDDASTGTEDLKGNTPPESPETGENESGKTTTPTPSRNEDKDSSLQLSEGSDDDLKNYIASWELDDNAAGFSSSEQNFLFEDDSTPSSGLDGEDSESPAKQSLLNPLAEIEGYPYKLNWVFGHQPRIPPINVSTPWRKVVFFVSGAIGVRYDLARCTQSMLIGHKNDIIAITATPDKRFIVTADSGPQNAVIIWSTHTGLIFHVIKDYFSEEGIICMAFDADMNFLLTLSGGKPQELALWKWKSLKSKPDFTFLFDKEQEFQHYAVFHPKHSFHFVSCSKRNVYFFLLENDLIRFATLDIHSLYDESTCSHAGNFTQTVFSLTSTLAVTGTTRGMIVLWGWSIFAKEKPTRTSMEWFYMDPSHRVCIRMLQVMLNRCAVTSLTVSEHYIVAGTGSGDVCYFDDEFNVIWSMSVNEGPVSRLCFSFSPHLLEDVMGDDASKKLKHKWASTHVETRDFMVFTYDGFAGFVSADDEKLKPVLRATAHFVKSFDINPEWPFLYIGDYNGGLTKWNYETKELLNQGSYKDSCVEIEFMSIDPTGVYIACVMSCGNLAIFETSCFSGKPCFTTRSTRDKPSMIKFSPDPQYLLMTDNARYVSLYRLFVVVPPKLFHLLSEEEVPDEEPSWRYGGKTRQHEGSIVDGLFNDPDKNEALFFFTLGDDRTIVIYDIVNSKGEDIMVIGRLTLEVQPIPICMTWYPLHGMTALIGVVSHDRRLRIYNYESGKMIKIVLLPLYEEDIKSISYQVKKTSVAEGPGDSTDLDKVETPSGDKLMEIGTSDDIHYFSFHTDTTIGMIKYPMDGNPNANLATAVHPSGINAMATNRNQTYAFVAGVFDCSVYMYEIDIKSLLEVVKKGGSGIEAYTSLFPSTEDSGELKKTLICSVYALELETKMLSLSSEDISLLKGEVPTDYLPYVLAAIGFYATPKELELMFNDLNVDNQFLYQGKKSTVNCLDIMKLYVNYRPREPLGIEGICKAFKDILSTEEDPTEVPRSRFLEILSTRGDKLEKEELVEILKSLENTEPLISLEEKDVSGSLSETETVVEEEINEHESAESITTTATITEESSTSTDVTNIADLLPEIIDEKVLLRDIFKFEKVEEDLSAYVLKKDDKKSKLVPFEPTVKDFIGCAEKNNLLRKPK